MEGSDGVPIDLFVSKTKLHITSSAFNLKFTDSSSNLVFSVDRPPPPRSDLRFNRLLSDSSGNPLIFISHNQKAASWEGFSAQGNHPLLFRVERTTKSFTRVEFQVFLNNQNSDDFKMRGSPFYRSCTIYKGDSIVAQTSLMYKLGIQKALVPRNRFRLTIFPGYADHAFIVALTVIFFYGRKLWI
ncbi:putative tubby-like protein [Helianthus debilis subsp. tardiflorus]